jgi:hypothetical protein
MKNIFFVMLILCFGLDAVAQQIGFTYQAVALDESKAEGFGRDSKGQILLNQPLKVRFSIHEQSADGAVQYQEVHETTTDIFGIFRVVIGSGEKLLGTSLETLQWSNQAYFMQVEIDLGNGFINMGEEVIVVPPFGLNNSVQLLNLSGTQLSISEGNSVDLGNLLSSSRLSEAEVDAFVANNGYLLTEVDGSVTNEIQDLQLSNNQLTITNNPGATVIDLSPYLNNSLTEQEVDDMVANNGYLTEEIQELNLSNNTLSITNNASATGIDLSPYQNVFENTNGVTSNENGNYTTDNFVFGSPQLDYDLQANHANRFFFTKAKGAFRAGGTSNIDWYSGEESWNNENIGNYSVAFGHNTFATGIGSSSLGIGSTASGNASFSAGYLGLSQGHHSIALGDFPYATGENSVAIGSVTQAAGFGSVAIGNGLIAVGDRSQVFGITNTAYSYGETVMGIYGISPPAMSATNFILSDRLFTIGNGSSAHNASNALVMLKNGNTRLHGQLTIDADNVNGAGEAYTLPGQDGAANQTLVTDGNGNVSWANADNSTTNEIQDLNLTNNVLTITNNSSATEIDLTDYENVFVRNGNVVTNTTGGYVGENFVFGSPTLDNTGNVDRMFFDIANGSFRVGRGMNQSWNANRRGQYSFASGWDTEARGHYSVSMGRENIVMNDYGTSFGWGNYVQGVGAIGIGFSNYVTGDYGVSIGRDCHSSAYAVSIGYMNSASGNYSFSAGLFADSDAAESVALGRSVTSNSYAQVTLGYRNTNPSQLSTTNWFNTDRLFVIGNGGGNFGQAPEEGSDALVMLKNGNTRLHGQLTIDADNVNGAGEPYTLPGQDGAANQTLVTDGNGIVTWANADNSISNELQDLTLNTTTNTLSISQDPTPAATIDLTPYRNIFETTNGVTSNENGNYATDDFVFGSPQLEDDAVDAHRMRMFFDKSKGAFRAGNVTSTQWDQSNTANFSAAFGNNTVASGNGSFTAGQFSTSSGLTSFASGYQSSATGNFAFAHGAQALSSGNGSIAIGSVVDATNTSSIAIGHNASSTGSHGIAIGESVNASGSRAAAIGQSLNASGANAIALGVSSSATGNGSTVFGSNNVASGIFSVAHGFYSHASGHSSFASGYFTNASSFGETTIGVNSTVDLPLSSMNWIATDRLFKIGNGADGVSRSDALVMLKNGNTRLHGQLTIDADNIYGAGEPYTLPGQDGAANQTLVTDGNGNVSWANADNSGTNEIQDLTLNTTTNTLSISQDPTPATTVDLTPYRNIFETTNGVTSNENGDYANDDFVFGGSNLNSNGTKFFFDKSKYAFRVGQALNNHWSDSNIGVNSFAAGSNLLATGTSAVAFGSGSQSTGNNSFSTGQSNQSHGWYSFTAGNFNNVNGQSSAAIGYSSSISSTATRAVALGGVNNIVGWGGVGIGNYLRSSSFSEIVLGYGNVDATPTSDNTWVPTDRLFVVGNGSPINFNDVTQPPNRSDALVMLKNGNTRLHGQLTIDADNVNGAGEAYTLPGQDGAANQTLVTDGNGAVSWQDVTAPILDRTTTIISNENGNYTTDSFVIGSPSLDDDGDANHDTRMFFEKSTGAFRVGTSEDVQWNASERGLNSVAIGNNVIARGNYSVALGLDNLAHSASSVAIGTNILAEGYNSIALGRNVATTGLHSMALAFYSSARSFGETTMGMFATDYIPNATQTFDANDRLFTIGNGTAEAARSNALVIYKNGDATLLGTLTDASDVRLKRNIKPLQNSLLAVNALQGVHYQWNGRKPQDTVALQTGLIAQEVEKIFPELVKTDEEGFKSVNYIGLVPHLIEAIKALKEENTQLKSANEKVNQETVKRLSDMESRLAQFEALLVKSNR